MRYTGGNDFSEENAWLSIKLYDSDKFNKVLQSYGAMDGSNRTPGVRSNLKRNACFGEIPSIKGKEGIKTIHQHLLVKQKDGTYKKEAIEAELQIYENGRIGKSVDDDGSCPPNYPCFQEVDWIIPKLPQGLLPANTAVVIEAKYTVTNPDEPGNVKKAKNKANDIICDTLKTMTWVYSPDIGTPPKWENMKWEDNYPIARIPVKKRQEEK